MFFVLILFLFLCLCFLNTKPSGILKKTKKYKIKISKKRYVSKLLHLKHKFLICENLNIKELKTVDEILFRLQTNCPKHLTESALCSKPVFVHEYPQKLVDVAKKYFDFRDFQKISLDSQTLQRLSLQNTNYKVPQSLELPKQKISILGKFSKNIFDFKTYKLTIFKNKEIEVAHYDFGKIDFLKVLCFSPTRLQFVYFDPLSSFDSQVVFPTFQNNFVSLCSNKIQKYFMFSHKPKILHLSKNKAQFSKKSCIIAYFDFFVEKSMDLQFCLSDKLENFVPLQTLLHSNGFEQKTSLEQVLNSIQNKNHVEQIV